MEEQLEKEIREEFTVSTPRKKHSTPSVVKREPSKETDEEIFEIVDYTLASPWEKFISQLEGVFRGWNLHEEGFLTGLKPQSTSPLIHSHVVGEQFQYSGRAYQLIYHYHQSYTTKPEGTEEATAGGATNEDKEKKPPKRRRETDTPECMDVMSNPDIDFPLAAHHLQRWFGFFDFLILAPLTEQGTTESEANLLLSTLSIVINECKCPVPGFVPVGERWKGNYLGYMRESAIHMRISSKLSQSVPAYLRQETLHGLISLYYRQLGMNHYDLDVASSLKDFILSVRYTHMRHRWSGRKWRSDSKNIGVRLAEQNEHRTTGFWERELVWGTSSDPIDALHLARTWTGIPVTANRMEPENFPWNLNPVLSLRCLYKAKAHCFLAESMKTLFVAHRHAKLFTSMAELRLSADKAALEAMGSISRSIASLRSTFPSGEEIDSKIRDIFDENRAWNPTAAEKYWAHTDRFLKAAPPGSLLCSFVTSLFSLEGLYGMGVLWSEFVRELHWHWENLVIIPRTSLPRIQYNSCLIYQKLQMLNHCIQREHEIRDLTNADKKTSPHTESEAEKEVPGHQQPQDNTSEQFKYVEDDDEIDSSSKSGWEDFDFSDDDMSTSQEVAPSKAAEGDNATKAEQTQATLERKGAHHKHEKLSLLNGQEMWIPYTQDVGHMTEDRLRERELFFADLGSSSEAAQIRANMQSSSLLSDMHAFKAANPECELEDFVRWYSPTDWVEEPRSKYDEKLRELKEGQLEELRREKELLEQLKREAKGKADQEKRRIEEKERETASNEGPHSTPTSPRVLLLRDTPKAESAPATPATYKEDKEKEKEKENEQEEAETKPDEEEQQPVETELMETEEDIYRCWPLRDDIVGHLSPRMQMPGNIWRKKWKEAQPIPVYEQDLLFDHAEEAEQVLHQLETMSPSVFMEEILTICFNCIYYSLLCLPCTKIEVVKAQIHNLHKVFLGTNVNVISEEEGEVLSSSISQVEVLLSRASSLLLKFPGQYDMVTELLGDRSELVLKSLAERNLAEALFADQIDPDTREFIFRSKVPRPYANSQPTAQRMYALLTHAEFRLASAFSSSDKFI